MAHGDPFSNHVTKILIVTMWLLFKVNYILFWATIKFQLLEISSSQCFQTEAKMSRIVWLDLEHDLNIVE